MFVSKKKYELAAFRADLAELQLTELYGVALKYGGLYKCILECREAAMAYDPAYRLPEEETL